jgi:hypothetical protein
MIEHCEQQILTIHHNTPQPVLEFFYDEDVAEDLSL